MGNLDPLALQDAVNLEHKCDVVKLSGLKGVTLSEVMCILSKSLQVIALRTEHLQTDRKNRTDAIHQNRWR